MNNILTSLYNTANALSVYGEALNTTENNVLNASTPGYARQVQVLQALPFDPSVGMPGGVAAGPVKSTRDAFAEQSVQVQQSELGYQQQISSDLSQLQNYFPVTGSSGLSPSIDSFFNSFSQLSINPNDTVSRQAVITQGQQLANAFQQTATGMGTTSSAVDDETRAAVNTINSLAGQIAAINTERESNANGSMDAGVDANLNADLEELSQYAGFKALQQPDGEVNVYLGGQSPLVMGSTANAIQADFSTPQTRILDSQGKDITSQVSSGTLAGMLRVKNTLLPSYMNNLNTLAQSIADQVNSTLSDGIDQNGNTPSQDLFAYDTTAGAALSLTVNPLTPDQIAAALPGNDGGNGNALALAQLGSSNALDGTSFSGYYGELAGQVGNDLSNANSSVSTNQQLLTQAQTLRSQVSGVSLDQEATQMLGYQRAYQATSQLVSIMNTLLESVLAMLPPAS